MTDATCNVGSCSTGCRLRRRRRLHRRHLRRRRLHRDADRGLRLEPAPREPAEGDCEDAIDNDGDGLIDCADTDCAGNAACKGQEVCGDCIDNDGDGLTDYEDPDCCADPKALEMRRMMLRPAPKKATAKRLNLNVRNTGFDRADLDPRLAGATLQISDPSGTILCQPIPAAAWTHKGKRSFRFKDKTGSSPAASRRRASS
jgi:hypothetical protein